jgi:hypothetical protein
VIRRLIGSWTRAGSFNLAVRVLVSIPFAIALVALFPGARADIGAQAAPAAATLHELRDVSDLKARFNDDRGKTRIVLLVSPT